MNATLENQIRSIADARGRLLATTRGLTNAQACFKPDAETWSIAENVEHLALAEMSGVTKIWAAIEAARAGTGWTGENPNHGLPIEEIVARTWKPRENAPPIATPHMGGPLAYWEAAFQSCQPVVEVCVVELEGLDPEAVIFPHFLCGPLNAIQRLEFLRFHIDRHIGQIQAVKRLLPERMPGR